MLDDCLDDEEDVLIVLVDAFDFIEMAEELFPKLLLYEENDLDETEDIWFLYFPGKVVRLAPIASDGSITNNTTKNEIRGMNDFLRCFIIAVIVAV